MFLAQKFPSRMPRKRTCLLFRGRGRGGGCSWQLQLANGPTVRGLGTQSPRALGLPDLAIKIQDAQFNFSLRFTTIDFFFKYKYFPHIAWNTPTLHDDLPVRSRGQERPL